MRRSLHLLLGFSLGLAAGCDDEITNEEACDRIIEACHYKDDGKHEVIASCHETAHLGGDCLENLDECVKTCDEAPPIPGYGTD